MTELQKVDYGRAPNSSLRSDLGHARVAVQNVSVSEARFLLETVEYLPEAKGVLK